LPKQRANSANQNKINTRLHGKYARAGAVELDEQRVGYAVFPQVKRCLLVQRAPDHLFVVS
jgi:hypothetical protein